VRKIGVRSRSAAFHNNSERGIPATHVEFAGSRPAPRLVIAGGSTRAAAWSAVRAGFRPVCADRFADRDLAEIAEIIPVDRYPSSLARDLSQIAADAWMFVGALENHPEILQSLRSSGRCGVYCGPNFDAISKLRDPLWLTDRLRSLGCYPDVIAADVESSKPGFRSGKPGFPIRSPHSPSAELRHSESAGYEERESPADQSLSRALWLRKPLASGGGRGICLVEDESHDSPDEPCYRQRLIDGVSLSALFLGDDRGCRLMWVSAQLIGCPAVAAPTPFTYCGSIGPWRLSHSQSDQLCRIAETLTDGLAYRGWLGLDLIWDGRRFWVIEVNPRYTASCELWEFATRRSAIGEHLQSFAVPVPPVLQSPPSATAGPILGKLILFADQDLIAPDLQRFLVPRPVWSMPWIADVPAAESLIPWGAPICTAFAAARTEAECQHKLQRRARRIRSWFRRIPVSQSQIRDSMNDS
jgi:uncharacterized protein